VPSQCVPCIACFAGRLAWQWVHDYRHALHVAATGTSFMQPRVSVLMITCLCLPAASWGSRLMQLINTTWPHPGHTFINAGQSASSLHTYISEWQWHSEAL
jgi:hypothetical protein